MREKALTTKPVGEPPAAHRASARGPLIYTQDRVCAQLGCKTRLSVYNGAELCSLHVLPGSKSAHNERRPAVSPNHLHP